MDDAMAIYGGNGNIDIPDLQNSTLVVENQYDLPYCTSMSISLPSGHEVTPIQLKGMVAESATNIDDDPNEPPTEANVLPFLNFREQTTNDVVLLEPGDALLCVNDDTDKSNPGYITGVVQNKTQNNTQIGFFERTKTYIIKAAEMAGYVSNLAVGIYDVYQKIKMFLPITPVTALIPANINGIECYAFGVDTQAKTDGNQVYLLSDTFELVGI